MADGTLTRLVDQALADADPREWCNRHRAQIDEDFVRAAKQRLDEALRSDARQALALGDLAVAAATLIKDPALLGLATRGRAQVLHQSGACTDAIPLYERASAMYSQAGDEIEAARTLIGAIDALGYVGRTDDALATAEKCIEIFDRSGENLHRAKVELNVGNLYHRLERDSESGRYYSSARATFARAADKQMVALADTNLGNVATNLCNYRAARSYFRRAARTLQRLGADIPAAMNEANIGWLDFIEGDYVRAIAILNKAKNLFEEHQLPRHVATCDADLAEVYLAMGRVDEADRAAVGARAVFKSLDHVVEAAKCLMTMAITEYRRGNLSPAQTFLREAREVLGDAGNEPLELTARLQLADICLRSGDAECALEAAGDAVEQSERLGLRAKQAHAQILLGRIRESLQNLGGARKRYESAWKMGSALGSRIILMEAGLGIGRVIRETEGPGAAIPWFEGARDQVGWMRGVLSPDELKASLGDDKRAVYSELIEATLDAGGTDAAGRALEIAEEAKSHALVELLAGRVEPRARSDQPADQTSAERVHALRKQSIALLSSIERQEHANGGQDRNLAAELQMRLADREEELAHRLADLEATSPEFVSLVYPNRYPASAIQEVIPEDAALIEFFQTEGRLMAFVVTQESVGVTTLSLAPGEVLETATNLAYELKSVAWSKDVDAATGGRMCEAVDRRLARLHDALIAPLGPLPKRLVFVMDGVLRAMPMHALRTDDGYLVDHHEVSYAPSARSLRFCLERARAAFDNALVVGVRGEAFPPVDKEVCDVAGEFEMAKVLTGTDASTASLRKLSHGFDVIHIASRGAWRGDRPLFPGIRMMHGWLSAVDAFELELNASLVTLSGYETVGNPADEYEEIEGIVRGLLYAGTPAVLTSLWTMEEGNTTDFMRTLYGALRNGASRAGAVRQAQLEMKSRLRHPYHWAPFVLNGAW